MHYDSNLLNQKLASIIDLQKRTDFRPAKRIQLDADKAEKAKERMAQRIEQQATKKIRQEKDKAKRELEKKAKDIIKARRIQRLDGEDGTRPKSDTNFGQPTKRQKSFLNRPLNLEQMIPVRVDHKTTVYMKPGDDPERIKEKYGMNRFLKSSNDTPSSEEI